MKNKLNIDESKLFFSVKNSNKENMKIEISVLVYSLCSS